MTSANDRQVGGDHYRTGGLQHWDVVWQYGVGYLEGTATKYVSRWRKKNGIVDLEKGLHTLEKIIESHEIGYTAHGFVPIRSCVAFARMCDLSTLEEAFCTRLFTWKSRDDLEDARTAISLLIAGERQRLKTASVAQEQIGISMGEAHRVIREILQPGTPEDGGHCGILGDGDE